MATKKSKFSWSGVRRGVLIALGVTLVVAALQLFVPAPELAVYNMRMRLERKQAPVPEHPDAVIIGIDDASLTAHGRWPWPRRYWAQVLDALIELKAKGVFFDISFPEASTAAIETLHGKLKLPQAVNLAARGARASLEAQLNAIKSQGGSRSATDAALLDEAFRTTFESFQSKVGEFVQEPDELVGDRLTIARAGGLLTGGVASVARPGDEAEASRARAWRRALLWVLEHPGQPVDGLPEADRNQLGPRLAELRGLAPQLPALAKNPNASQYTVPGASSGSSTALLRELIRAWMERGLAGVDVRTVDREAIFQKVLPPPFRELGNFSQTLFEQGLSQQLLEESLLWTVEDPGHVFPVAVEMSLPTFEIARGYGVMGIDWETKDTDGAFRSVPLMCAEGKGFLPTGGLAVFLAMLTAGGGGVRPKLARDGATLVITPKEGAAVRVPIEPGGRMLINWTGPFEKTFTHVPAGTLLTYAGIKRERDRFLAGKLMGRYEPAMIFLERLHELQARAPASKLSLNELAKLAGRGGTDVGSLLKPPGPLTPASVDEPRTPGELAAFLEDFRSRVGGEYLALQSGMLRKKLAEPGLDPTRHAKYSGVLAEFDRYGANLDALRADLTRRLGGKIAFIGHTATSSTDLAPMPFSTDYPKVGSYPNVLSTLASGRFIQRPWAFRLHEHNADGNPGVQLGPLFLVCLVAALAISALSARRGMIFSASVIALWGGIATYVFVHNGVWIDIAAPITGIVLTHGAIFSHSYGRTENVRKMFESYVDPHIVDAIIEDESLWTELGGREQQITAFFSDIAGFTTLSELLGAHELSEMLTDYLSPMTDIILHQDGIRDKYIGDAIVAFFGAPVVAPGHELNAALASIAQQETMVELKKQWLAEKKSWYTKILSHGKDLEFRIGLNTGKAKVGNFGSHSSKNYTMIGDTVNLAARLEGANKEYGSFIMCGENTKKALGDAIVTRELDRLVVKGKIEAVRVFEVVGRAGAVDPFWPELLGTYAKGLQLYHARDFVKAKAAFEECLRIRAGDGPAEVYVERSEEFIKSPPPPDWNGAYVMLHK